MKKKTIIWIAVYAIVLCIVAAVSLIFASSASVKVTARFSSWFYPDGDNLLQLEVDNPQNSSLFEQSYMYVGWYDVTHIEWDNLEQRYSRPGMDGVIRVDLPSHGTVHAHVPECDYQYGRHCHTEDIRFILTGKFGVNKRNVNGGLVSF